jgi:hypothetical protein
MEKPKLLEIRAAPWEWGVLGIVLILVIGGVLLRYQQNQRVGQFKSDADTAVSALERVSAAVEVGVSREDHRRSVAEAKAVTDRYLAKWPEDLAPPLRTKIMEATSEFVNAVDSWNGLVSARDNLDLLKRTEFHRQFQIVIGGKMITQEDAEREAETRIALWEGRLQQHWGMARDSVKEARKLIGR